MILENFWKKGKEKEESDWVDFQVSRKSFKDVQEWADEEGISVEDVISKSISMYEIARHFRKQGLGLASINDEWEIQAKLTIPGITTLDGDPSPSANKAKAG